MYELLKGLRVVEGAAFIAGPSCTMHMAQMGAEVIRFDNIGGGPDFTRWPVTSAGKSLYWEGMNKGKKSIALNLSSPQGRELAVALATAPGKNAGLFVTNYPVDGFLSYARLREKRDDIICVRVMGWADGTQAMDPTINAAVGIPLMTGAPDTQGPVNHSLPAWDLVTGAYAAFAMMAAIHARAASGKGYDIRVPLSDIAMACLSHTGQVAEVLDTGTNRPRTGNHLFGALGRDFVTRDGRSIILVALTGNQWQGLVKALGIADAVQRLEQELDVSFTTLDAGIRYIHRERLCQIIEPAIAARDSAELYQALDANSVTWGPYQTVHEAVTTDPRLVSANPLFQTISHPSGLTYPAAGPAATFIDEARGHLIAAPRLGAHTDEILAEVLRLPDHEIGRLHDAGIVAGAEARV
jgi:2-methylfumaryl-CoA isomerase